jgi:hypothetical protein
MDAVACVTTWFDAPKEKPSDPHTTGVFMAQKQKPSHEIRLGRIRAAIWANENGQTNDVWFNVTVSRLYKDGDSWKDSSSFRRDDLPVVSKVADMAYAWIWGRHVAPTSDEVEL